MKKLTLSIVLILVIILVLNFISAEKYTINIKGESRTSDGKIDLMYDAGSIVDDIKTQGIINNDDGSFELENTFESQKLVGGLIADNSINVYVTGTCFYHSYNIMRKNNQFEVSDAYDPEHKVIMTTKDTNIDLGILKEDMSNQIMVDFDVPVSFKGEDASGNIVAENSGFRKFTGMSNSFRSRSTYNLILKDENGNEWKSTITTGDYCESTRVIKRGSYFITETHPNNSFPPIGFFRNIWLSILGFRMIVIIPITLILLVILIILFLIFKRRKAV